LLQNICICICAKLHLLLVVCVTTNKLKVLFFWIMETKFIEFIICGNEVANHLV
jgi:hypothetical protein